MHLHLFFTTSIGYEEEYTSGIGFNWDQGKRWMDVNGCIQVVVCLVRVYTYVSIWLIQIHWHICIQKVFGVSRRFSTGSRGTRNMFPLFFFVVLIFFYLLLFRNMQFGEYWGSVRPYVSLSDCLVKADKNLLYCCCCCCDGLKTICQIQSCEICYLFFYWSNRTFLWNF